MKNEYNSARIYSYEEKIPRDERALLLIERLCDGRARTVEDVKQAFKEAKIPGWEEYLKEFKYHITRKPIAGHQWVYRYDVHKQRVELDEKTVEIMAEVLEEHDYVWDAIPLNAFNRYIIYKRRISDYLKYAGVYICSSNDAHWSRHHHIYPYTRGLLVPGFSELRLEDRNWLLGEEGQIAWMIEEQDLYLDCVDGDLLWTLYGQIIQDRVSRHEFMRCCELVEMYQSLNTKDIFKKAI